MATIIFRCPKCRQLTRRPDDRAGSLIECRQCYTKWVAIPESAYESFERKSTTIHALAEVIVSMFDEPTAKRTHDGMTFTLVRHYRTREPLLAVSDNHGRRYNIVIKEPV